MPDKWILRRDLNGSRFWTYAAVYRDVDSPAVRSTSTWTPFNSPLLEEP